MIEVYSFRVWDSQSGDWVYPERKSPAERIEMARGEIIPGSGELIDPKLLDHQGWYEPNRP